MPQGSRAIGILDKNISDYQSQGSINPEASVDC